MVEIWQILEVSDISTSLQGMMMVGTGGGGPRWVCGAARRSLLLVCHLLIIYPQCDFN